jgi:predicted  nucleic acid-binding Zn-ribbon protein
MISTMQHACFACRKVFKKPGYPEQLFPCPECGAPMHMMGKAFRAPKQSNTNQWKKAQLLIEAGFLFQSGSGARPKTLNDAAKFIQAHRLARQSKGERLLRQFRQTQDRTSPPTRAGNQGRVKRLNLEGRPRFELLGRELKNSAHVLISVDGKWLEGYFGFTGDGLKIVKPYVRVSRNADFRYVFMTENTALRWPD